MTYFVLFGGKLVFISALYGELFALFIHNGVNFILFWANLLILSLFFKKNKQLRHNFMQIII